MSMNENPSTDVDTVSTVTDDLDLFSAEFFGQNKAQPEQASPEKNEDKQDVEDAPTDEDTHSEEDTLANDEDDTDEEEIQKESKPKKNRFQERIDKLTSEAREAQRERDAFKARLEKLEQQNDKPAPTTVEATEDTSPQPDDLNEDGSEKYPLGEFDPQFIRDLTRFTLNEERKALKAREDAEAEQNRMDDARNELQSGWSDKLETARERYPDFQEKGETLISAFDGLDPSYGEYLSATIMGMDYGADVLYYLANNHAEAEKIVAAGPTRATIMLGRLESKFMNIEEEDKQKDQKKVTKAPPPPPVNKGSAIARVEVEDDTDDLDAFSQKFFKRKG